MCFETGKFSLRERSRRRIPVRTCVKLVRVSEGSAAQVERGRQGPRRERKEALALGVVPEGAPWSRPLFVAPAAKQHSMQRKAREVAPLLEERLDVRLVVRAAPVAAAHGCNLHGNQAMHVAARIAGAHVLATAETRAQDIIHSFLMPDCIARKAWMACISSECAPIHVHHVLVDAMGVQNP